MNCDEICFEPTNDAAKVPGGELPKMKKQAEHGAMYQREGEMMLGVSRPAAQYRSGSAHIIRDVMVDSVNFHDDCSRVSHVGSPRRVF